MKLAIITGASSGIGRQFALQLKEKNQVDSFWLIARREERISSLAKELNCPCKLLTLDLTKEDDVQALMNLFIVEKPEVDYFINAAGFGVFGSGQDITDAQTSAMIELNVKTVARLSHAITPFMKRGSHMLQMGSASCFTVLPYFNIYASTKAFVLHFSKALAVELKPLGIGVTCFCPGWVETEFLTKADSDSPKKIVRPEKFKPLLKEDVVVAGAIRALNKNKLMYVTNWFTKLQHLLSKLTPSTLLTNIWLHDYVIKGDQNGKN